jgi:hypothetical protein
MVRSPEPGHWVQRFRQGLVLKPPTETLLFWRQPVVGYRSLELLVILFVSICMESTSPEESRVQSRERKMKHGV